MKYILITLMILTTAAGANAMESIKSKNDFYTTLNKLEVFLKEKDINIFTNFNHSQEAKNVGMELNLTNVTVFGNPKVGTLLMQENQEIAIELPLKILVWENDKGEVFVGYQNMIELGKKYNIKKNAKVLSNMQNLVEVAAKNASN